MFILGTGIGLVMQILVTAVQNAVGHEDLGAATAGANFFRSIGGSFGHGGLRRSLRERVASPPRVGTQGPPVSRHRCSRPRSGRQRTSDVCPLNELSIILHAISGTIDDVYRFAVPIGVLAVILSLTLPEVTLRTSVHPVANEVPMSNADPLL